MDYASRLPSFDPSIHLTSADLRAVEKKHGYGDIANSVSVNPNGANGQKITKAGYETRLFTTAIERFTRSSVDHPPYGLVKPTARNIAVMLPQTFPLGPQEYFSPMETQAMLAIGSMKTFHAVSDLKLQCIIHELLTEAATTDEFLAAKPSGDGYARIASEGRAEGWKQTIQSAASNAKRSEFIALKQIMIQWMRTMERMPTREEFEEIAIESQALLEILATTHQSIFKTLNGRIIEDANAGKMHKLIRKGEKGQLTLEKRILDNMTIERSQNKIRTMCAALLAKDSDGISLLQHSYREDMHIVADMLYLDGEPRSDVFESVMLERLPNPSIHMFLKLKRYDLEVTEAEGQ